MVKEEIDLVFETFDKFKLSEEQRERVVKDGINFSYKDNNEQAINGNLTFIEFAKFLNVCTILGLELDIEKTFNSPCAMPYKTLVKGIKDAYNLKK